MRRDENYLLELKEKAESIVQQIEQNSKVLSAEEIQKIVHDFHVYQIELELQNEELRNVGNQLEKAVQQFYHLYNNTPVSHLVLDENEIITHANNTFCNLIGKEFENIVHKPFSYYILDSHKSEFNARFKAFFKNPVSKTIEIKLNTSQSKTLDVRIEAAQISSDKINLGKYNSPLLLITLLDITEIKLAQEKTAESEKQLKELNAERDKFFSIIAHDLRSPFNGLLGMLGLFKDESESFSDENKALVEAVFNSAKGVYELLDNLLNWANAQTGRLVLNPSIVEFNSLIIETVKVHSNAADLKGVKFRLELRDNLNINIDKDLFNTVLRNLIGNAIKYSNANGEIFIQTKRLHDKSIELMIKDEGIGISETVLNKLFRPGELISQRGTKDEKGTGLGLIICKEFVQLHNGELKVESLLGVGTTITVKIPQ